MPAVEDIIGIGDRVLWWKDGAAARIVDRLQLLGAERLEDVYTRVAPRNPETSPGTYQASAGGRDTDRP